MFIVTWTLYHHSQTKLPFRWVCVLAINGTRATWWRRWPGPQPMPAIVAPCKHILPLEAGEPALRNCVTKGSSKFLPELLMELSDREFKPQPTLIDGNDSRFLGA